MRMWHETNSSARTDMIRMSLAPLYLRAVSESRKPLEVGLRSIYRGALKARVVALLRECRAVEDQLTHLLGSLREDVAMHVHHPQATALVLAQALGLRHGAGTTIRCNLEQTMYGGMHLHTAEMLGMVASSQ